MKEMTIVVTLKEPNLDWNDLNVKRFEDIIEFYTSITDRLVLINNKSKNYNIPLDKVANILITP